MRHEAWEEGHLVGLMAAYFNQPERRTVFMTSLSVLPAWYGRGLGDRLMRAVIDKGVELGFAEVWLQVDLNSAALPLHRRLGFVETEVDGSTLTMTLPLPEEK